MVDTAFWLNLASFAGVAVLAVPVFSLNSRRKRLQDLRDADRQVKDDGEFRSKARRILIDRRRKDIEDWRPFDEKCLRVGYGLLFASAFLRLFF